MISRQFQHVETELMQIVRSAHEGDATLTVVCNNRTIADDLKIIATRICKRVEADAIAVQHSDADLGIIKPLLKDLLRLKRSDAVMNVGRSSGLARGRVFTNDHAERGADPGCLEAAAGRAERRNRLSQRQVS